MLDPAIAPLLAARGVVAFAHVDWSGTWYSRHQILSRLARICPVVVVDHPVDARDVLAGRAPSRAVLHEVAPNLWSYRSGATGPARSRDCRSCARSTAA